MRNLLAQSLYRSFHFTIHHYNCFIPTATLSGKVTNPARTYSLWKPTKIPEMLSDVEEHVERDFSYPHLKKKLNEDSQLTVVTKETTLSAIRTIDGVLNEIATSYSSGTLWPEELNLYFGALIRKTNSLQTSDRFGNNVENNDKPAVEILHDDPAFQVLVKQSLVASFTLPTNYLSQFFAAFVKLNIPPLSNTMLLLTARIQDRINEIFPDEALFCLDAIRFLERHGIFHMQPLRDGLLMHLENQLLDPPTFARILQSIPISRRLTLLRYGPSTELASFMLNSIKETAHEKRERSLRNRRDAEFVLTFLMKQHNPKKYLWGIANMYFDENPHELTELSKRQLHDVQKRIYGTQHTLSGSI